jgi:hypothetical protein
VLVALTNSGYNRIHRNNFEPNNPDTWFLLICILKTERQCISIKLNTTPTSYFNESIRTILRILRCIELYCNFGRHGYLQAQTLSGYGIMTFLNKISFSTVNFFTDTILLQRDGRIDSWKTQIWWMCLTVGALESAQLEKFLVKGKHHSDWYLNLVEFCNGIRGRVVTYLQINISFKTENFSLPKSCKNGIYIYHYKIHLRRGTKLLHHCFQNI